MSDTAAKLVRMANQIAANLARDRHAAQAIAAHIHAFWTPRMIEQLRAHGRDGLAPLAIAALERLPHGTAADDGA